MTQEQHDSGIKCSLCTIPIEEIGVWAERRFIDNISTLELLKLAKNDREKEIITVVGMLDVDDKKLNSMLETAKESDCNIYACRQRLRIWLQKRINND